MSNVLNEIVRHKWTEIEAAQQSRPLSGLQAAVASAPPPRDFVGALRQAHPTGLIAEVKKASPSAGIIRADFHPVEIARTYEANGAACLSVLTDEQFFQGHLDFLRDIRQTVSIPVLRKDFIVSPYQVWEARAAGADCILLIAECLDDESLSTLSQLAASLGMQSLVEIYESDNISRVLALGLPMIGINNRDLRNFATDLGHCIRLREQIPAETLVIGESGIHTREDVERLACSGIHGILVGESLMRSADIGEGVRRLLGR